MQRLFEAEQHEALTQQPWDDAAARAAIARIAAGTLASFSPDRLWPAHPLDDGLAADAPIRTCLYDGAAGVIWTLRQLAQRGFIDGLPDFTAVVRGLPARLRRVEQPKPAETASFLMGDSGLLLLQWSFERDPAVADQLFETVEGNLHHPSNEALWGNPGSALAAIHMAEASGEPRWTALLQRAVQCLQDGLHADPETGTPVWTQDLYGRRVRFLGAGHGLAGNVWLALRGAAWLDPSLVQRFCDAALATLQATALHGEGGTINWHPMSDAERVRGRVPPVQDCHGAPGLLLRLGGMPRSAAWDALLDGAAELTWQAGPLVKGPGLCHGTSGNALALLRHALRTGNELWRQRALAMAWHAAEQVQRQHLHYGRGRHSLWTGDLGVAWVLAACLEDDARLPVLDRFF